LFKAWTLRSLPTRKGILTPGNRNDSINGKDEYYYDPVGRIKKHTDPLKRVKEFVHDKAGNYLKTEIKEEENSWKRVGTYDKISYEYDKAGNLIQRADTTFKWDSNNRLVTSQKDNIKTEYKYDPLGRRISKETEGKITNFYWEVFFARKKCTKLQRKIHNIARKSTQKMCIFLLTHC
jgi:YD repeat-containing protein